MFSTSMLVFHAWICHSTMVVKQSNGLLMACIVCVPQLIRYRVAHVVPLASLTQDHCQTNANILASESSTRHMMTGAFKRQNQFVRISHGYLPPNVGLMIAVVFICG